jgi:hypothetical protein
VVNEKFIIEVKQFTTIFLSVARPWSSVIFTLETSTPRNLKTLERGDGEGDIL